MQLCEANMGPIMQERTASTTLKRVVSKEKIRVKNAENNGTITTSSKKGNNKVKKAGTPLKIGLPSPGQDKDTVPTAPKTTQYRGSRVKSGTSRNSSKLSSPQEDGVSKSKPQKLSIALRKEEKREVQRTSPCCAELDQNHGALGSRRGLSLPLSPIPGLRQGPTQSQHHTPVATLESLRHYESKEDDTDSASDLSDSERLPILPSPCTPCTPPHLNLRAEVINSNDFPPDFPGPRGGASSDDCEDGPSYSYPEFLPPPFNTWSLRQLAVFLHTEGRGAPRPKPVGTLEKYLERLLQLEWLQIQTVQAESGRPSAVRPRPVGFPPATTAHPPRPHTAPPTRLNSPKGPRQCQRAFLFAQVNNPPSPTTTQQQLSRLPVCPHCHIRYPLCNGSCSAYAYQRHSRLSPLLERRARPGDPTKRSSSETRASSSEGRATGGGGGNGAGGEGVGGGRGGSPTPGSSSAGRSSLKHMQAVGNVRKPSQEPGANGNIKGQGGAKKGRVRANSDAEGRKESGRVKGVSSTERSCGNSGSKREANNTTTKRAERERQKTEAAGGQPLKIGGKKQTKETPPLSKAPLGAKQNGKAKNVHFVAK